MILCHSNSSWTGFEKTGLTHQGDNCGKEAHRKCSKDFGTEEKPAILLSNLSAQKGNSFPEFSMNTSVGSCEQNLLNSSQSESATPQAILPTELDDDKMILPSDVAQRKSQDGTGRAIEPSHEVSTPEASSPPPKQGTKLFWEGTRFTSLGFCKRVDNYDDKSFYSYTMLFFSKRR